LTWVGAALVYHEATENASSNQVKTLGPQDYFGAKSLFFGTSPGACVKAVH
jgi:hypothetical protein